MSPGGMLCGPVDVLYLQGTYIGVTDLFWEP